MHAKFALEHGIKNTLVPHEGAVIRLKKDDFEIEESIKVNTLLVDGLQLVPLNGDICKERDSLLESGIVVATLTYSKKKGQVRCDDITFVGLFEKTEEEEKNQVIAEISTSVGLMTRGDTAVNHQIIEKTATRIIRDIIAEVRGVRPTVIVHIIDIR